MSNGIGISCHSLFIIVCCDFVGRNPPKKPSGVALVALCHFHRLIDSLHFVEKGMVENSSCHPFWFFYFSVLSTNFMSYFKAYAYQCYLTVSTMLPLRAISGSMATQWEGSVLILWLILPLENMGASLVWMSRTGPASHWLQCSAELASPISH